MIMHVRCTPNVSPNPHRKTKFVIWFLIAPENRLVMPAESCAFSSQVMRDSETES
jgi:hypothetical protein